MLSLLQERRPLKRARLGPPDVYPQEAKQREDELTPTNVKHGFTTLPALSDEFGTAHNSNINASKVSAFFSAVLAKKEELMTLQDTGRKKQQINFKDSFYPVSPRSKSFVDVWFKDLAGNKPLLSLAKRPPSFNKKEEILIKLCENQVNMQRATWFIKLSAAYTLSFTESKNKKRCVYDPTADWTGNIVKFMRDLLPKLQEYYNLSGNEKSAPIMNSSQLTNNSPNAGSNLIPVPSMSSPVPPIHSPANGQQGANPLSGVHGPSQPNIISGNTQNAAVQAPGTSISGIGSNFEDCRNALKYWKYCTQLSKYMYEEALLDRQEFLNWILELLDRMRTQANFDEPIKKLVLSLALQYMSDFVQSERLCRKLSYIVCKYLSHMLNSAIDQQNRNLQPGMPMEVDNEDEKRKASAFLDPCEYALNEYVSCPHHRDIVLYLSTILQVITIECPTALVWCGISETRAPSSLVGSPLDHLPLPISALPMPSKCQYTNSEIRRQLRTAETDIALRSKHAENRWFAEKWLCASKNAYTLVLCILDILDSHNFELMDQCNSIDTLYANIFPPFVAVRREMSSSGELKETRLVYDPKQDASIVKILCEWAVSKERWGEHRAIVVALLLDKRQIDVTSSHDQDQHAAGGNEKESIESGAGLIGGLPVFQHVLMSYLDNDAPIVDDNSSIQHCTEFTNLVQLFGALIRHDVFSHNAYMHTLISRGDLLIESTAIAEKARNAAAITQKTSPPTGHSFDDDFTAGLDFKHTEFDDSNVDEDIGKLVQNIKEKGQQHEPPDSPKIADASGNESATISRHYIYTKHFPIPQDDPAVSAYSSESNQRYILLFGVGKERDEKKHAVKKMAKEICKLFTKKFSIDVAEAGKVKKHARNEFIFEATTSKCQHMAIFDQHVVTSQCAATVLEQLNSFAIGNNNYLPVIEHVAFLFDLMELALNVHSLLELCDQILKEIPEIEYQLQAKKSSLTRNYTTNLALYVVSILRRYHSCLLLSPEQTASVFDGLCIAVKHVSNVMECSSAERCIIAYLGHILDSCGFLKIKEQATEYYQQFSCIKKLNEITVGQEPLTFGPQEVTYPPQFIQELLKDTKRGRKIDPHYVKELQESPLSIYTFVCNIIVAVCQERDNDQLNDIAFTCAELTASCYKLTAEWIASLQGICSATLYPRYSHLVRKFDIFDVRTHNSLAVFVCILAARHCFCLAEFMRKFALPILASFVDVEGETEAGTRFALHLIMKLFKTVEVAQPGMYSVSTSPNPLNAIGNNLNIKLSCDRHLLVGAHRNIPIAAVLAVLKAMLVVVDAAPKNRNTPSTGNAFGTGKRSGFNTPVHPGSTPKGSDRPVDLSQILGTSDLNNLASEHDSNQQQTCNAHSLGGSSSNEQVPLLEFALHVLKEICAQEHILERCLKNADQLCDMLIDAMLSTEQTQRILHMICYPETEYNIMSEIDQRSMIVRVLENLGQWTMRISWVDLQLMYRQAKNNPEELNIWLDTVARAAIDVFQMEEAPSHISGGKPVYKPKPSTWLVGPLISKLTTAVQGRILRVAGQVLKSMNYFSKLSRADNNSSTGSGDEREKSNSCHSLSGTTHGNGSRNKKMLLNYQPFLGLILTCLKDQDEHKEDLLISLYTQLSQCVQSFSDLSTVGVFDDPNAREEILDALQLRFSLIGGMFDAIQRNGVPTTEWAILFTQLVCQGVVDLSSNRELFTTLVDMLATLVHSTLASDCQSERDENKKSYLNLMKKLKKEIGEKNNASIRVIRQLLPIHKQTTEVISCEPAGVDAKGNKICDMDKKQLRVSDKQRISVWDILEGHKNPAPLSWVWFGAVKLERKPLTYEEAHKNLKYHTHSLVKPMSYYYEPLPLPPEDVEPVPEKISVKDEMKADTPSSVDRSSPSTVVSGRGRGKSTTTRKRKAKTPKAEPVTQAQAPSMVPQQPTPQQLQHQHQQHLHQQQQQQSQQQQQQHMNQMQMNQMQVNMQQFGPNPMMQQNQHAMMAQQQQMQQQMGVGNQQQMNFAQGPGGGPQGVPQSGMNQAQQQNWPAQGQYHNQYAGQPNMPMNRFERPQPNANSKQALSQMLRQRQPASFNQNNAGFNHMQQQQTPAMNPNQMRQQINQNNPNFNPALQQQQQQQNVQQGVQQINPNQQQQLQQQQFARANIRGMAPNQMAGGNQMINAASMGGQGMNQNAMMQQQMAQAMGAVPQSAQQGMMLNANTQMLNTANAAGANMIGNQNANGIPNAANMMQQNVVGVNQNMVNQSQGSFQNFQNQYQHQQSGLNPQQGALMGNFNQQQQQQQQMGQRNNTAAEFLAQQQQRGVPNAQMAAQRNQYMNQAPNVTMGNMMNQGAVPPYSRQQPQGGKPGVVTSQQQFQQQQQQQQQMRHQQMMHMGLASGPQGAAGVAGAGGMMQPQGQGMGQQQQTPNLVAQLQRQMPTNQGNMMGQQYGHQPPPY